MLDFSNTAQMLSAVLVIALVWMIPIAIAIWFIRTLSAMAAAQGEIAARLSSIDAHLRSNAGRPAS